MVMESSFASVAGKRAKRDKPSHGPRESEAQSEIANAIAAVPTR